MAERTRMAAEQKYLISSAVSWRQNARRVNKERPNKTNPDKCRRESKPHKEELLEGGGGSCSVCVRGGGGYKRQQTK